MHTFALLLSLLGAEAGASFGTPNDALKLAAADAATLGEDAVFYRYMWLPAVVRSSFTP